MFNRVSRNLFPVNRSFHNYFLEYSYLDWGPKISLTNIFQHSKMFISIVALTHDHQSVGSWRCVCQEACYLRPSVTFSTGNRLGTGPYLKSTLEIVAFTRLWLIATRLGRMTATGPYLKSILFILSFSLLLHCNSHMVQNDHLIIFKRVYGRHVKIHYLIAYRGY